MVHGVHGDQLLEEVITEEEMEVYGVDWEGLNHDRLLQSQRENNHIQEGLSSWIGQTGPPQHLNEVPVYTQSSDALTSEELLGFSDTVRPWYGLPDNKSKLIAWSQGLGYARAVRNNAFWSLAHSNTFIWNNYPDNLNASHPTHTLHYQLSQALLPESSG